MKPDISAKRLKRDKDQSDPFLDESQSGADLEYILEWVRLGASHARKSATCVRKHREILKAKGETEERLRELDHWRESMAFTERGKAALSLSESISLKQPKKISQSVLKEAHRHLSTSEMIRLTLAVMAVNDWIDLHPDT